MSLAVQVTFTGLPYIQDSLKEHSIHGPPSLEHSTSDGHSDFPTWNKADSITNLFLTLNITMLASQFMQVHMCASLYLYEKFYLSMKPAMEMAWISMKTSLHIIHPFTFCGVQSTVINNMHYFDILRTSTSTAQSEFVGMRSRTFVMPQVFSFL